MLWSLWRRVWPKRVLGCLAARRLWMMVLASTLVRRPRRLGVRLRLAAWEVAFVLLLMGCLEALVTQKGMARLLTTMGPRALVGPRACNCENAYLFEQPPRGPRPCSMGRLTWGF